MSERLTVTPIKFNEYGPRELQKIKIVTGTETSSNTLGSLAILLGGGLLESPLEAATTSTASMLPPNELAGLLIAVRAADEFKEETPVANRS